MRVRWLRRARASLDAQVEYIGQFNPVAAANILDQILDEAAMLADYPLLGRVGRVGGA